VRQGKGTDKQKEEEKEKGIGERRGERGLYTGCRFSIQYAKKTA
jgi:hypothetical protein